MKNKALSPCSVQTWNVSVPSIGSVDCGKQSARKTVVLACVAVVQKAHVGGALPCLWLGINGSSAPQRKDEKTAVEASDRDKRRDTRLPAVIHVSSVAQSHPPRPAQQGRPRSAVQSKNAWWPFNPNGSAHQQPRPYHQQLASRCRRPLLHGASPAPERDSGRNG
jgi:hypothetical protein